MGSIEAANIDDCIYCGACFRYCVLHVYEELDGMELKNLVSGVTRIARRGYKPDRDARIREFLDKCTLQGYCNKVCPALVKPLLRNEIAKKRIEDES